MDRKRFSVLIADQNAACRQSLSDMLEPEGYGIHAVESGREAIRVIHRELVHVVVMDLRMPDYSGLEIYHAIKDIRDVFLPCIFTAAEMTPRSIQEALGEDAITILPKPVDAPRLVHAVDWSIDRFYSRRPPS